MPRKTRSIPVNNFGGDFDEGISIERVTAELLPALGEWEQPERHDRHSFFLLEQGRVMLEIDFQRHEIHAPAAVYMHPDQVHRILLFEQVTASAWAMTNPNLNPEYLTLLEELTPVAPFSLSEDAFALLSESVMLGLKLTERKDQLSHAVLKDACNALVGLLISLYMERSAPAGKLSRPELVTKAFREALALHFTTLKRPADYAEQLHLSAPYLNECVRNITGQPVTYHIQQRVILEAQRLLYHSNQSLKEIAAALGYDDYAYFSRLFTKVAGLSPASFRSKNLG